MNALYSNSEIVDVVDKKGKVLYQIDKQIAHNKGLLHKTVIAEVINSKGECLLVKPHDHKQDAGQYVSPVGGHMRSGESDEEALRRETREEIGIDNFTFRFIDRAIFNRHVLGRHENHYFYVYEIFTDEKPKLGDEAESCKWFAKDELKKALQENPKDFGDSYIFVVKNFVKKLSSLSTND